MQRGHLNLIQETVEVHAAQAQELQAVQTMPAAGREGLVALALRMVEVAQKSHVAITKKWMLISQS